MSSGTATLAVGNPSSGPPRPSPRTTGPRTSWGRPSSAAAASTSPSASRVRMRVDETGSRAVAGERHPDDLEAVLGPEPAQELDVAPAAVPEVEVLPHHDQARLQLLDQHLLHEVLGRLVRPRLVEGHHHRPVDAALGQQLELLLQAGQLLGRRLRPHHVGGVAVEGDHDGGEPGLGGPLPQVAQQGPVPEMDAVVGPDGDRGAGHRLRG